MSDPLKDYNKTVDGILAGLTDDEEAIVRATQLEAVIFIYQKIRGHDVVRRRLIIKAIIAMLAKTVLIADEMAGLK